MRRFRIVPARCPMVTCGLIVATLGMAVRSAQGQFGSVINIPPSPNIPDNSGIGSSTQVNLYSEGTIGVSFEVGNPEGTSTDVELNVRGGAIADELHANAGSVTHVLGGRVGNRMEVRRASVVNVSGGNVSANIKCMERQRHGDYRRRTGLVLWLWRRQL